MNYEIMFIVKPALEENELKLVVTDFEQILTNNKAKIISSKEMGQQSLAYEIKKHKSGYYFLYEVELNDSKKLKEINRLILLNENIIRFMIVKKEKEKR